MSLHSFRDGMFGLGYAAGLHSAVVKTNRANPADFPLKQMDGFNRPHLYGPAPDQPEVAKLALDQHFDDLAALRDAENLDHETLLALADHLQG